MEEFKNLKELRNLIARYKELEKQLEEKEMQHELELIGKEEYTKEAMGEIIENYYTANEDCILKSKVQEKIEELNLKLAEDVTGKLDATYNIRFTIQVLQELLEES